VITARSSGKNFLAPKGSGLKNVKSPSLFPAFRQTIHPSQDTHHRVLLLLLLNHTPRAYDNARALRPDKKLHTPVGVPPSGGLKSCSIEVRLIGADNFTRIDHVLDDTGSELLELYEVDDCARIGLTEEYEGWEDPVQLDTVNGKITRSTFMVEVRLLAEGRPFGPICEVLAYMAEGAGGSSWRCSGGFLRQELFTATSPRQPTRLYISDRKTGVTRDLPA